MPSCVNWQKVLVLLLAAVLVSYHDFITLVSGLLVLHPVICTLQHRRVGSQLTFMVLTADMLDDAVAAETGGAQFADMQHCQWRAHAIATPASTSQHTSSRCKSINPVAAVREDVKLHTCCALEFLKPRGQGLGANGTTHWTSHTTHHPTIQVLPKPLHAAHGPRGSSHTPCHRGELLMACHCKSECQSGH